METGPDWLEGQGFPYKVTGPVFLDKVNELS